MESCSHAIKVDVQYQHLTCKITCGAARSRDQQHSHVNTGGPSKTRGGGWGGGSSVNDEDCSGGGAQAFFGL